MKLIIQGSPLKQDQRHDTRPGGHDLGGAFNQRFSSHTHIKENDCYTVYCPRSRDSYIVQILYMVCFEKHTIQLMGSCGGNPHSVDVAHYLGLSVVDERRCGPNICSDGCVVSMEPVLDLGGGVTGQGGKGHPGHDDGRVRFT